MEGDSINYSEINGEINRKELQISFSRSADSFEVVTIYNKPI